MVITTGVKKAYIRIGGPSDVVEKYPVVAVCRDLEAQITCAP